jgi:hypothetical protein
MRRTRRFWLTETPEVIRGVEYRQDAGSGCGNQKQGQSGFSGWHRAREGVLSVMRCLLPPAARRIPPIGSCPSWSRV